MTSWYGPATTAVMYVDIGGVAANTQRATPSRTGSGAAGASLETTFQRSGAVTVRAKVALRSGWSKQA